MEMAFWMWLDRVSVPSPIAIDILMDAIEACGDIGKIGDIAFLPFHYDTV